MILRYGLVLLSFVLSACEQTAQEAPLAVGLENGSVAAAVNVPIGVEVAAPNALPKLNALHYALPESAVDSADLPTVVLQPASGVDPLPYYEVGRDTYLLFGNVGSLNSKNRGFNSNAGFVVTSKGVVLIDALGTPMLGRRLIATVAAVTDLPITHLILTSLESSHSLGSSAIAQLPGVTVIAAASAPAELSYSDALLTEYRQRLPEDMQGLRPVSVSKRIVTPRYGYETLLVGEHSFEMYSLAGAALMLYQVDDDILWLSDLASNQVVPDLSQSDLDLRRQTLEWLQEHFAEVELMVPGHGSAQSSPFVMLEQNVRYLDGLNVEVKRGFDLGLSLAEILAQVTLLAWSEWHLYEQHHQANVRAFYQSLTKSAAQ
ncbi:MAG: MBL fold metallo-hydrolase [Gammaproteobacteria bacterium]|nr:MBL fold metallo-hydrolase [Gammaproteobacteria bacterium]